EDFIVKRCKNQFPIRDDPTIVSIARNDVLIDSVTRPERLAGFPVKGEGSTILTWDTEDDFVFLAFFNAVAHPVDLIRVGRYSSIDQYALKGAVKVPAVARKMLVVPDNLTCVSINGQCGVRVE